MDEYIEREALREAFENADADVVELIWNYRTNCGAKMDGGNDG